MPTLKTNEKKILAGNSPILSLYSCCMTTIIQEKQYKCVHPYPSNEVLKKYHDVKGWYANFLFLKRKVELRE